MSILLFPLFSTGCKKSENPMKYARGTFPDTIINIADINSPYDDYNIALYQLGQTVPIIFSSNRESSGGQFDLEQASISCTFLIRRQEFLALDLQITTDPFLTKLIDRPMTPGNDFGPVQAVQHHRWF